MEFLTNAPTWQIFISIGLVLLILEVFVSGFVLLPLGLGFILAAYFTSLVDSLNAQLIILAAFELVVIYLFTKYLKPKLNEGNNSSSNVDSMIGKEVLVIKEILPNEKGYIKLYGDEWAAVSDHNEEIPKGSKVQIIKTDGNKVIVKPIL